MKFTLIILTLLFCYNSVFAQGADLTDEHKDTVCFSYNFQVGDTLVYFVESADSIVIDYGEPLLKIRRELLEVTVDKVTKEKNYILKLKLLELMSKETTDGETVERTTSPWIGRTVFLEIDSLGNRLNFRYDDSLKAGLTPGGAFQSYLFFPFKVSCKKIDESWSVSSLDMIAENGNPVPLLRQYSLFKAGHPVDTLNFSSNRFDFVKTGQGNYEIDRPDQKMVVTNILNGHGIMTISDVYKVPVHYYSTAEQKITISTPGLPDMPGWHYITTNYTLVENNLNKRK